MPQLSLPVVLDQYREVFVASRNLAPRTLIEYLNDLEDLARFCSDRGFDQADLLKLSTDSKQLFADQSGHLIMIDQPQAAIEAIIKMFEQVRK